MDFAKRLYAVCLGSAVEKNMNTEKANVNLIFGLKTMGVNEKPSADLQTVNNSRKSLADIGNLIHGIEQKTGENDPK